MPLDLYDKMGDDDFNHWVLEVVKKVYDAKHLFPAPEKGRDGGIDIEYVYSDKKRFIIQIKGRNTVRQTLRELRPLVLKEIKRNIAQVTSKKPHSYLFITNIELSGENLETVKQISMDAPFNVDIWHFPTLCSFVREYPHVFSKFDPRLTAEELQAIIDNEAKNRLLLTRSLAKKVSEENFLHIQNKVKNLFVDNAKRKDIFFGFIYLLEPYYLDGRGQADRKTLRRLLDIDEKVEVDYIASLKSDGSVVITENLISVADRDRAKTIIKEGVDSLKIPIDNVIDLFVKQV